MKVADVTRNLAEVSDARESLEKDLEQTKALLEKEKEERAKVTPFSLCINSIGTCQEREIHISYVPLCPHKT